MPARQARPRATLRRLNRSTRQYQTPVGVVMFKPDFVIVLVLLLVIETRSGVPSITSTSTITKKRCEGLREGGPADIPSHARYPSDPRTTRLCEKPAGHARWGRRSEDRRGLASRCRTAQSGDG